MTDQTSLTYLLNINDLQLSAGAGLQLIQLIHEQFTIGIGHPTR
ncbi:MAG TPA: hypothetical protein VH761_05950 [Ilumatobacteraceae bacterium]